MCKKYLEAMPHVVEASKLVVQTCEDAFKVTRWNCSTINLAPEYLSDLTRGKVKKLYTKEIPIHLLNPACHPPGKLLDMEDQSNVCNGGVRKGEILVLPVKNFDLQAGIFIICYVQKMKDRFLTQVYKI